MALVPASDHFIVVYAVSLVSGFLNLHCREFVYTLRNDCSSVPLSHVPYPKNFLKLFSLLRKFFSGNFLAFDCMYTGICTRKNIEEEIQCVAFSEENKISKTHFLTQRAYSSVCMRHPAVGIFRIF